MEQSRFAVGSSTRVSVHNNNVVMFKRVEIIKAYNVKIKEERRSGTRVGQQFRDGNNPTTISQLPNG